MTQSCRKYDREFKKEKAVRLVLDGGRGVVEDSRGLGIHANLFWKWKRAYLEDKEG